MVSKSKRSNSLEGNVAAELSQRVLQDAIQRGGYWENLGDFLEFNKAVERACSRHKLEKPKDLAKSLLELEASVMACSISLQGDLAQACQSGDVALALKALAEASKEGQPAVKGLASCSGLYPGVLLQRNLRRACKGPVSELAILSQALLQVPAVPAGVATMTSPQPQAKGDPMRRSGGGVSVRSSGGSVTQQSSRAPERNSKEPTLNNSQARSGKSRARSVEEVEQSLDNPGDHNTLAASTESARESLELKRQRMKEAMRESKEKKELEMLRLKQKEWEQAEKERVTREREREEEHIRKIRELTPPTAEEEMRSRAQSEETALEQRAREGDPEAIFLKGLMSDRTSPSGGEGEEVANIHSPAAEFYKQAALLGHADAQACYGHMLETQLGGLSNAGIRQAVRWYRKGIEGGSALACNNLARLMLFGKGGVEKDPQEAVRLFQLAAEQGSIGGMNNLGVCKMDALGTPRDKEGAKWLFEESSCLGHAPAQLNLAHTCIQDGKLDRAAELLHSVLLSDCGAAEVYALGFLSEHHQTSPTVMAAAEAAAEIVQRKKLASRFNNSSAGGLDLGPLCGLPRCSASLYEAAATLGDARGQHRLGAALFDANLMPEALVWYQRSAEQNNPDALNAIGCIYELGLAGKQIDREKAKENYLRAKAAGCRMSETFLEEMERPKPAEKKKRVSILKTADPQRTPSPSKPKHTTPTNTHAEMAVAAKGSSSGSGSAGGSGGEAKRTSVGGPAATSAPGTSAATTRKSNSSFSSKEHTSSGSSGNRAPDTGFKFQEGLKKDFSVALQDRNLQRSDSAVSKGGSINTELLFQSEITSQRTDTVSISDETVSDKGESMFSSKGGSSVVSDDV